MPYLATMRKLLVSAACCLNLTFWPGASPAQTTAVTLAPTSAQVAYVGRVRQIEGDLRWSVATLFLGFEQMQTLQAQLEKPKRNTDVEALGQQRDKVKAELQAAMKKVQLNAQRLRALSPVPRTWKRWDDRIVDASFDFERGVDGVTTWLLYPADEVKNAAAKLLRHGQSTLDDVTRDLARRTERGVWAKKYL